VKYTSTSDVKIDRETLLHYASLMPGSTDSKKPPSPPPEPFNPNPKSTKTPHEKPQKTGLNPVRARDAESIIRGLADTAALFEKFGCVSGQYWGVVFSHVDGGRIGVAYVGDQLPDILLFNDEADSDLTDEPPAPAKRLRISSTDSP
jgi:hypothetical protein